jgi:hypothetical protein
MPAHSRIARARASRCTGRRINALLAKKACATRTFPICRKTVHDPAATAPETAGIFALLEFSNLYRVAPLLPLHPKMTAMKRSNLSDPRLPRLAKRDGAFCVDTGLR